MLAEGISSHCKNRMLPASLFAQLCTEVELRLLTTACRPGYPATSVARRHGDGHYKHRCRYCCKGFHGESALQIHVRSHTGTLQCYHVLHGAYLFTNVVGRFELDLERSMPSMAISENNAGVRCL